MKKIIHRLLIQNWKPKTASLLLAIAVWFLISDHLKRNPFDNMPKGWLDSTQSLTAQ